jgi:hypothetical protein
VTFKDLQKLIESQPDHLQQQYQQLERLRGKEFWYWDSTSHKQKDKSNNGACCFNHTIGLSRKDGIEKPFFDYERLLYKALLTRGYLNSAPSLTFSDSTDVMYQFREKHLWIKKATGLGVTEFMLRFMAWLCLRNDDYRESQMVIVTGPNQELAIGLIKRMKGLFANKLNVTFDSKDYCHQIDFRHYSNALILSLLFDLAFVRKTDVKSVAPNNNVNIIDAIDNRIILVRMLCNK